MSADTYFAHTQTITIATTTKDGREITTPIWGVLVDGVPYIRNGYGEGSSWYRRARRAGHAAFIDRGTRYEARIEAVNDDDVKKSVDAAYTTKYSGQGGALRQVVASPARDYTLKVLLGD